MDHVLSRLVPSAPRGTAYMRMGTAGPRLGISQPQSQRLRRPRERLELGIDNTMMETKCICGSYVWCFLYDYLGGL